MQLSQDIIFEVIKNLDDDKDLLSFMLVNKECSLIKNFNNTTINFFNERKEFFEFKNMLKEFKVQRFEGYPGLSANLYSLLKAGDVNSAINVYLHIMENFDFIEKDNLLLEKLKSKCLNLIKENTDPRLLLVLNYYKKYYM